MHSKSPDSSRHTYQPHHRRPLLLLGLLGLLGSCSPAPEPETGAPAPGQRFTPAGLVEITFNGVSTGQVTAQAHRPTFSGHLNSLVVASPTLAEQSGGLQLKQLSSSVFNTGIRGAGGQRYINVSFKVRNADSDGSNPSPTARSNLTLIAVGVADSADDTGLRLVQTFGGTATEAGVARTVLPTHAMQFSPSLGRAGISAGGEDLQVFSEAEVLPGNFTRGALPAATSYADLGVTNIFPYGYVVRNPSAAPGAGRRSLPANPAASQYDGRLSIAVRVPLQADDVAKTPPEGAKRDPWTFNMLFLVVQDSVTSVTQSPEDSLDGNQTVQTRAADTAASRINVLPGSTFPVGVSGPSTTSRRVCQVRTGGSASTPASASYLVNTCP